MARPARPWFRFYVEAMSDPKMRRLSPAQKWLWVAVLAASRQSCMPGFLMVSERVPYSWADLADYAGMKLREVERGTDLLTELGMIEFDPDLGAWCVPKWNDRQYESDSSTERTAKHRHNERGNNGETTAVGTPPETETETESERGAVNGAAAPKRVASGPRRKRKVTPVPASFELTDDRLAWCRESQPGLDPFAATQEWLTACAAKDLQYVDWDAAWKNAMRRAARWHQTSGVRR